MEVKIGEYGRMMFEMMTREKDLPEHWQSIKEKAEPLVRELIRLNSEMKNGGYSLVGYKDESGKMKLSTGERIKRAQHKLWGTTAGKLKVGDKCWFVDHDYEMYIGEQDPGTVDYKKKDVVAVEVYMGFSQDQIFKLHKKDKVLKAPADWDEDTEGWYTSHEFWLEQADKLGI